MFMEVAMSDLQQLLTYQNVTKGELISYILNVCDSIEIMATNFLYHGDLHIGNIFLVKRNTTIKAVVGDFGESEFITSHLQDMKLFISSLSSGIIFALNTSLLENKLSVLMKHISRQIVITQNEYEIDLQKEKIRHLVSRDMDIIKDIVQGIF